MNTVLIHPFGSPFAYNAALAFHERRQLHTLHTCLFDPLGSKLRYHEGLKNAPISAHPAIESIRLLLARLPRLNRFALSQEAVDFVGARCDLASSRRIPNGVSTVYGYEDFALRSFEKASTLGAERIYDLPIGFHTSAKAFLEQESQHDREIRPFLQALNEPTKKIARKEAEISLATQIVCASSFTAGTVPERIVNSVPVSVIPYGVDCSARPKEWEPADQRGRLKLIFVGRLDPRKGLHVLFQALQGIPQHLYELSLAGRWVPGFKEFLHKRFPVSYRELGQVPRNALHDTYRQHHALVFPSLFEGFGLVLLEAMAAGLPVITTERTAGPDIIGKDGGFIVQAGNVHALRRCIEDILDNRKGLPAIGSISRRMAETFTWSRYRSELFRKIVVDAPAPRALTPA